MSSRCVRLVCLGVRQSLNVMRPCYTGQAWLAIESTDIVSPPSWRLTCVGDASFSHRARISRGCLLLGVRLPIRRSNFTGLTAIKCDRWGALVFYYLLFHEASDKDTSQQGFLFIYFIYFIIYSNLQWNFFVSSTTICDIKLLSMRLLLIYCNFIDSKLIKEGLRTISFRHVTKLVRDT